MRTALLDGGRRERLLFGTLAVALVLLRCFVPTRYEGYFFDSDQAIVGLMAKHLAELKTLPLFYYGLNYLLGVQAWIIAPFFWIARPSVAVMRLPLVILNAVVAVWLIAALARRLAIRPALAFVAALPFVMPTPATAAYLLQVSGASIEPFVYVLLLWALRRRPLAFGALLAIAYLHREFVIFTVPALLLVEAGRREFWSRATLRRAGGILVGFGAVWLVIDDLRMRLSGGTLGSQLASLGNQTCLSPAELGPRVRALVTAALPLEFGGSRARLDQVAINDTVAAGSTMVGALVIVALAIIVVRLVMHREPDGSPDRRFGMYLAWVGVLTSCAYPLSCNVILGGMPLLRYLLFALLVPVGLAATFFARERSRAVCAAVAGVFVVWGAANLVDNVRVVRQALVDPPSSEHRALADYLVGQHIRYARATYWDVYVIDFLSRERVIVASVDLTRYPDYEREVDAHAGAAVTLQRLPCSGPVKVASWCISPP